MSGAGEQKTEDGGRKPASVISAPPAAAPVCEYRISEPGLPQRRCGGVATHARNTGHGLFHYCETCARTVDERTRGKHTLFRLRDES